MGKNGADGMSEDKETEMQKLQKEVLLTDAVHRQFTDTMLRISIGKTDDIRQPLCMHAAIIAREFAAKGILACRVCGKRFGAEIGWGRYNDHLTLRHPECVQPICTKCAKEKPDEFHKAFKRGVAEMEKRGRL
jgi:hypothetical protein